MITYQYNTKFTLFGFLRKMGSCIKEVYVSPEDLHKSLITTTHQVDGKTVNCQESLNDVINHTIYNDIRGYQCIMHDAEGKRIVNLITTLD